MAEDIYANSDELEMISTVSERNKSIYANVRPEDAVASNPSAAVRNYSRWAIGGLGLLCVLLLALSIGVSVQYMKERGQLSMERDQLQADNTNLTRQVDQLHATEIKLQDRISKLTKRCPSEWIYFNTKCYRYDYTAKTWSDSRAHCQIQGGDLVVIGSREEQDFIHGLATRRKPVWIGLKRENATWKWVNNDEACTTFWDDGQPDNGREECGVLDSIHNPLSSWHDYYCSAKYAIICQSSAYM